ncbi:MAG: D-3-phosphoglycerate dehydrogenase [Flavobacteriales bacterium]|jgi:D-3-phosphoglycerate dehydrogenase
MRILFIDSVHPTLEEQLTASNFTCEHDYTSSYAELLKRIALYEGIVIRSRIPLDKTFLSAAHNLKFIARSGAGLENIDLVAAKELSITVFNSPEGNRDAVGEQAIGMLLMLFNHLKRSDAEVRKGIWLRENNRGEEIAGKTIGIIGYGMMGSALAKKLFGFDCNVIAHDKYKTGFSSDWVQECSLEQLQAQADVISLHLPQSDETHYYVNHEFIANCAKPFVLINTARGKNVEVKALVDALKSGKVRGACLDVLEFEKRTFESLKQEELPLDFQYLTKAENVILSPHVAGWTKESYVKLSSFLAEKILAKYSQSGLSATL